MQVIILGSGIVGLTAANLLAQDSKLNICVVDANIHSNSWGSSDYDIRCSAITHASQSIFNQLGIWQDIIADRAAAYDKMLVWDQEPKTKIQFSAAELGVANLGHVIENRVIHKALYKQLLANPNISIINSFATAIEFQKDYIKVTVGSQDIIGNLVIGADGANSWLRDNANIQVQRADYGHVALVACIESDLPHDSTARQRFMPDGPLAFLPLADQHYSSIVWSSKPEIIQELLLLEENVFCERLSATFAHTLGTLRLHGKRVSFPLEMMHATQYVMPRIALIGDAVHVIHPLAGQGLNLGLLDAACLAECVHNAILQHRDIGGYAVLRKYERSRKGHNLSMITLVDTLKRLFASENMFLKTLRGHSMHYLDNFDVAKNAMMRFALGWHGLPRLQQNKSGYTI
jgi:2-octaprenylphenol hydroxylase